MQTSPFALRFAALGRFFFLFAALLATAPLCLTVRPAQAEVAVGTNAGNFLGFEVGASSAGIAGANTSVASGASSQFWNPSLTAFMSQPQASMMHATWLGNLQYEWIGYARPLGPRNGVGSVSVAYFHMPSISGVDEFDNPTGDFRVYDMALTLGYARPVLKGLMLGANTKVIRQTLATETGTGVALDLGLSAVIQGATFGATVQNLGPNLSFGGASYPLPQLMRFGLSRPFYADRLLLAADYTFPKTYYNDMRIGAEFRPNPVLAVRAGYRREFGTAGDPANGISFGLGAHVGPVNLDYAMTPDNAFADIHRLSFGYTFSGGEAKPEPPKRLPKQPPVRPTPKTPPPIAAAPVTPKPVVAVAPETPKPAIAAAPVTPQPAPVSPPVQTLAQVPAPTPAPASPPKRSAPEQYEVVLGNYQTETNAQSELKALRILGFALKDALITFVPGTGYRLSLVRFNSRKPADELAASLTNLSFSPRVETTQR